MEIVVIGAGQVGQSVAEGLDDEHEIVVVDHDPDQLSELRYRADVMTYEGDGADIEVLEEAGVGESDMVIASTDDDRTNILVCGTARALNPDVFNIARVKETGYLKSWRYSQKAFSVDLMVGSDYLTARSIVQTAIYDTAQLVEHFCEGRVEMAELEIPEDSELAGTTAKESELASGLRYAAVFANGEMEVVRGDTIISGGARLLVIGRTEEVHEFGRTLSGAGARQLERVYILGGGNIAYQTARAMTNRDVSPKVVEPDRDRAEYLARNLPDSFVMCDDPTDPAFLTAEGVPRAQLVLSAFQSDDRNLLTAIQARQIGADRALSVVHERKYASLFEGSGVQATFNPRREVIEEILRHTRERHLEKVTFVEDHQGEVLEVELEADSPLVGHPLKESAPEHPEAMVIGAVLRRHDIIIPDGETVLNVDDNLVIFAASGVVDELLDLI